MNTSAVFKRPGDTFPALLQPARFYTLAGTPLEYSAPTVLRETSGYLKGCKVQSESSLPSVETQSAIVLLTNAASYGDRGFGARCFFPGFAIAFGEGDNRVIVQVCLECSWVVFHSSSVEQWLVPSDAGVSGLRRLYEKHAT